MKLEKNYELPKKEIDHELRKFLGHFTLNFWKVYTKLIEFQNPDEIVWRNRKNAVFKILLFFRQIISSFIL